jgi:hypothetical protein
MRSRLLPLALLGIGALATLGACKRLETGAREHFERTDSCPKERIAVRERADLAASSLLLAPVRVEPPDDVAADPGRLAIWKREQAAGRTFYDARFTVFEARGCGRTALLACTHPNAERGGTALGRVVCIEGPPRQ